MIFKRCGSATSLEGRTGAVRAIRRFIAIVVFVGMLGWKTLPAQVGEFKDVPLNHPYRAYISLMGQTKITDGCDFTPNFCPDRNITRGEMAVFMDRAFSYALKGPSTTDSWDNSRRPYFTDVPVDHVFFKAIQKLRELGITLGCTLTTYCPGWYEGSNPMGSTVTWGEMVTFAMRAWQARIYGVVSTQSRFLYPADPKYFNQQNATTFYYPFMQKAWETGIFNTSRTCLDGTSGFCASQPITRGEAALFVVRAIMGELGTSAGQTGAKVGTCNDENWTAAAGAAIQGREYIRLGNRVIAVDPWVGGQSAGGGTGLLSVTPSMATIFNSSDPQELRASIPAWWQLMRRAGDLDVDLFTPPKETLSAIASYNANKVPLAVPETVMVRVTNPSAAGSGPGKCNHSSITVIPRVTITASETTIVKGTGTSTIQATVYSRSSDPAGNPTPTILVNPGGVGGTLLDVGGNQRTYFAPIGTGTATIRASISPTEFAEVTIHIVDSPLQLQPQSQTFAASGGSGSFQVQTTGNFTGTVTVTKTWLVANVIGNTVNFFVNSNSDLEPRQGAISVAGRLFTITQGGAVIQGPRPSVYPMVPPQDVAGNARRKIFTASYGHSGTGINPVDNLKLHGFLVGVQSSELEGSPNGAEAVCQVLYSTAAFLNIPAFSFALAGDSPANNWMLKQPNVPVSNSQCTLHSATAVQESPYVRTLTLDISFPESFGGTKDLFLFAQDLSNEVAPWQKLGVVHLPTPGVQVLPSLVDLQPGQSVQFSSNTPVSWTPPALGTLTPNSGTVATYRAPDLLSGATSVNVKGTANQISGQAVANLVLPPAPQFESQPLWPVNGTGRNQQFTIGVSVPGGTVKRIQIAFSSGSGPDPAECLIEYRADMGLVRLGTNGVWSDYGLVGFGGTTIASSGCSMLTTDIQRTNFGPESLLVMFPVQFLGAGGYRTMHYSATSNADITSEWQVAGYWIVP